MINYYCCIRNAAHDQATLNKPLKGSKKNDKRLVPWTAETDKACDKCLHSLANTTLVAHPCEDAPLILATDISNSAIEATLEQVIQGKIQPLV